MSDQTTYHALMSWDGSDMRPSTALLAEDFPLSSDDVVSMNLFIFAAPISAEFCQGLTPQSSCGDFPNCRASIQRRDFSLIAGQSMSFRDDLERCITDVPFATGQEVCDGLDNDCDGETDERCTLIPNCVQGETIPCRSLCGEGVKSCTDGEFGECSAAEPIAEICTHRGDRPDDEDCDGRIDEGCQLACDQGSTRACRTRCGGGVEVCVNGHYQECNAPVPVMEVCDDIDNDCDERVDEDTEISQDCLAVVSTCEGTFPGVYSCTSGAPVCEVDELLRPSPDQIDVCDGLDNDCDGVIDNDPMIGLSCAGEVDIACAYSEY